MVETFRIELINGRLDQNELECKIKLQGDADKLAAMLAVVLRHRPDLLMLLLTAITHLDDVGINSVRKVYDKNDLPTN